MKDVLDEIVAHKRVEVERLKAELPPRELYAKVERLMLEEEGEPRPSMRSALLNSEVGIIAEFKRKSPSKGWIKEEGSASEIPLGYQQNGASAISILTDERYFGGNDDFIRIARQSGVTIPVLYKNFVIDEYQLFQARHCGASAALLIAADLRLDECKSLLSVAHELGLEVLLEMHSERELDYAELEPDMYGINNRNLGTFITDVQNSFSLASKLPLEGCKVSESGISNPETVRALQLAGFNGFLIGENFMKTDNPGGSLSQFIETVKSLK
ncbi:MAG: indole-3-glycerol phosphate synthase TrpC [Prevotella sp.]|nr:indole-3-glycerol phosphate synthase TrpC [Prevotella sp.]